MDTVKQLKQCSVKGKFFSVKKMFCFVNAKYGAAKIYGLRLGFSNSNLSSHTYFLKGVMANGQYVGPSLNTCCIYRVSL